MCSSVVQAVCPSALIRPFSVSAPKKEDGDEDDGDDAHNSDIGEFASHYICIHQHCFIVLRAVA